MRCYLIIGFLLTIGAVAVAAGPPFPILASSLWVKDGDTFYYGSKEVRMRDWNAPEINYPRCSREKQLAYAAKNRLINIVRGGNNLALQFEDNTTARQVWPSLTGSPNPRYNPAWSCGSGRYCGRLFSNGVDVGSILASEGLAAPYCVNGAPCEPLTNWCQ